MLQRIQMKICLEDGMREEVRRFHALSGPATLQEPLWVQQCGITPNPVLLGLYGDFIAQALLIIDWVGKPTMACLLQHLSWPLCAAFFPPGYGTGPFWNEEGLIYWTKVDQRISLWSASRQMEND